MKLTFNKQERLCSKKQMELLFSKGKNNFAHPLKFIFIEVNTKLQYPAQIMFVVPKRQFKKAHDRNKLKRRMREAYRLNKGAFYESLKISNKIIIAAFIYVGKKPDEYKTIEKSIQQHLNLFLHKPHKMININDKEKLFASIDKFKEGAKPLFGVMTPQHVLEHLIMSLHLSTGKKQIEFKGQQEIADKIKATLIYTNTELPQGIKNPLLTDELSPLKYNSLEVAKQELKNELNYFYNFRQNNPTFMAVHPRMNNLNLEEWTIIHSKHFSHHFKQYGLI